MLFTLKELLEALSYGKLTAPGEDYILYKMVNQLSDHAK